MSELFQETRKLLKIRRINSTAFNPHMQGKVEKLHLGLNQTMGHYVNKYGSDCDEFVKYALMAHRATRTPSPDTVHSICYIGNKCACPYFLRLQRTHFLLQSTRIFSTIGYWNQTMAQYMPFVSSQSPNHLQQNVLCTIFHRGPRCTSLRQFGCTRERRSQQPFQNEPQ